MRHTFQAALLALGLPVLTPAVASAHSSSHPLSSGLTGRLHQAGFHPPVHAPPELDPNAAGAALTLLVGGIVVRASKHRKPRR